MALFLSIVIHSSCGFSVYVDPVSVLCCDDDPKAQELLLPYVWIHCFALHSGQFQMYVNSRRQIKIARLELMDASLC